MLEAGGVISLVGAGGKTSLMFRLAQELSAEGATVLTTTTTRIFMPAEEQSRCVILADTAETILERAAQKLNEHRHITAAAGLSPIRANSWVSRRRRSIGCGHRRCSIGSSSRRTVPPPARSRPRPSTNR